MPIRIQRSRAKGWKKPENTVNVTRPGPWGNPFTASLPIDAVRAYSRWLRGAADLHHVGFPPTRDEISALRGKNLMCWCAIGQPCHADILLELANPKEPASG